MDDLGVPLFLETSILTSGAGFPIPSKMDVSMSLNKHLVGPCEESPGAPSILKWRPGDGKTRKDPERPGSGDSNVGKGQA